jgi:hypothetical protein
MAPIYISGGMSARVISFGRELDVEIYPRPHTDTDAHAHAHGHTKNFVAPRFLSAAGPSWALRQNYNIRREFGILSLQPLPLPPPRLLALGLARVPRRLECAQMVGL